MIEPIYQIVKQYKGVDIITYEGDNIISGLESNEYTEKEMNINKMHIKPVEHFSEYIYFPVNKLLITGEPKVLEGLMAVLKEKYHSFLNIYRSEPYFLEVMP